MWNQFVPSLFSVRRGYKLAHTTRGVFLSGAVDPGEMRRVLLVIAHPDDESMFFGPTLLALAGMQAEVSVLCLSTGNFEGKGKQRSLELKAACRLFNISEARVYQKDHTELQDGPLEVWSGPLVARLVAETVALARLARPDTVITFDDFGVSGHPNHRAVHRGVKLWVRSTSLSTFAISEIKVDVDQSSVATLDLVVQPTIKVLQLVSTSIIRKFSGALDILFWLVGPYGEEQHVCFMSYDLIKILNAMRLHGSQWVWFRMLFVFFGRYSYINTFKPLH